MSEAAPAPVTAPAPIVDDEPKVFVGNLAFSATEQDISAAFSLAGEVTKVTIIRKYGKPQGYGFVSYKTDADAHKAVELLNKQDVLGRPVNVDVAKPREPRAEGEENQRPPRQPRGPRNKGKKTATASAGEESSGETSGAEKKQPKKQYAAPARIDGNDDTDGGNVTSGEGASGADKKKKRNRKKTAKKTSGGDAAVAAENSTAPATGASGNTDAAAAPPQPKPRAPRVPREKKALNPDAPQSKTTLFVANLPFKVDSDALKKIFGEYKVVKANVVRLRNGRSKGFGFIEVVDEAEQAKILKDLEEASLQVDGRDLSVRVALDNHDSGAEIAAAPVSVTA